MLESHFKKLAGWSLVTLFKKDSGAGKRHYTIFYKNNFKRTMRFTGNKNRVRTFKAEISTKTFYPSLENRNVL